MNNTYVFFVGGTGARVLRSLIMLLASGNRVKDGGAIIPIIIDYDVKNGDLLEAKSLLDCYCNLSEKGHYEQNEEGFFRQKVEVKDGSYAAIQYENSNKTFGDFLSYAPMSNRGLESMQKLLESLFDNSDDQTTAELNLDMSVGFKGNPNIGSVVFDDYFRNSAWKYDSLAAGINSGDKIFVIGSIFGGTGSSGIPQLIKNFEKTGSGAYQNVQNAIKGACLVLPYFGVKPSGESAINSSIFNSKTKAALSYYNKELNDSLDEVYYIGCKDIGQYENHQGGDEQKNNAHLVELLAAMSILDFANRDFTYGHKEQPTAAYEFGVTHGYDVQDNKLHDISYLDLLGFDGANPESEGYLYHLNSFAFFCKYFMDYTYSGKDDKQHIFSSARSYYKALGNYIGNASEFGKKLYWFSCQFRLWSEQMAENSQIKFMPYDFKKEKIEELICVNEKKPYPKGIINTMQLELDRTSEEYKDKSHSGEYIFLRCAYAAGCSAAKINVK